MSRLILALCLMAAPAHAVTCAPLAEALAGLESRYGEVVRADALMTSGHLLVITASEAGGWTALVVSPDMTACIIAAGEHFATHAAGDDV